MLPRAALTIHMPCMKRQYSSPRTQCPRCLPAKLQASISARSQVVGCMRAGEGAWGKP